MKRVKVIYHSSSTWVGTNIEDEREELEVEDDIDLDDLAHELECSQEEDLHMFVEDTQQPSGWITVEEIEEENDGEE